LSILRNSKIALGVTGGIAAYKACELASQLVQAGARVDVIMTANAQQFVGAATFQALTKRPVHLTAFEEWTEQSAGHVSLARDIDALVVAPATANILSKLAHGAADDMLSTTALATSAPLIVAPAMEHSMFHHAATQANIALLQERGATLIGPESGRLASGEMGDGRLASTSSMLDTIRHVLGRNGPLAGRHVVVTAGGTQEAIDPVRFLGNRSSGLMGYALARAAIDLGAKVTLITGPGNLEPPITANIRRVVSAFELMQETKRAVSEADVLVMAAAVADYRPKHSYQSKIKKGSAHEPTCIALVRNPDVLASIDCPKLIKIGFAAETEDLVANARKKLNEKQLAMIVANDAVQTIGNADSSATILTPDLDPEVLPQMSKDELAAEIMSRIAALIASLEK
jgi:phosphopantothenoylcysteine decarboxylase / phosphopantothenate---cysteine ligase